jgi:hypothetical protein
MEKIFPLHQVQPGLGEKALREIIKQTGDRYKAR